MVAAVFYEETYSERHFGDADECARTQFGERVGPKLANQRTQIGESTGETLAQSADRGPVWSDRTVPFVFRHGIAILRAFPLEGQIADSIPSFTKGDEDNAY